MNTEHMPSADRLRSLLMGRKIVSTEIRDEMVGDYYDRGPVGYLTLDDGVVLKVWGNDGGCACSSGCYPLTELNECDNIITNVEVEDSPMGDYHVGDGYYRIFVFADNRRINVASFDGSDGNGYYGTGWWLAVSEV
jgi:hypothetical protein